MKMSCFGASVVIRASVWLMVLLSCRSAWAGNHFWQGPANGTWATAANWVGGVPTSGEPGGTVVEFANNTSSVCNLNVTVDVIYFNGSGNSIVGNNVNVLTLSGATAPTNITCDPGATNNTIGGTGGTSLPVVLTGNTIFVGVGASCTLTIASSMSGSPGIRFLGPGTVALQGASNTYTGLTIVNSGLITLDASSALSIPGALIIGNDDDPPSSAVVRDLISGNLSISSAVTIYASGVLDLNGHSERADVLSGNGTVLPNGGALLIGTNNGSSEFDGTFKSNGALDKMGTGTLVFGGYNNNYTGSINVLAGTLLVNSFFAGPVFGLVPTTVGATGTLGGTGFFCARVTMVGSGGTIAPGAGTVPTTFDVYGPVNLTNGKLAADIIPPDHDVLLAEGGLTLSNSTLVLTVPGTLTQNVYILATYFSLSGTFANVITNGSSGLPAGYTLDYAYDSNFAGQKHIALVGPVAVVTGVDSGVSGVAATLNGSLNPAGMNASFYFEYGDTLAYGHVTPVIPGQTGTAVKPVSAVVTGLDASHTYHYRLVVLTNGGATYGADATFSTAGPEAFTGPPLTYSALSATFSGTANPEGVKTTVWYEYGPTPAYGKKTPVQQIGSGSVLVIVNQPVAGLTFGTLYHYRLVASSAAGTCHGADVIFTTLSVLPPVFTTQPATAIFQVGSPASLSLVAKEGSPAPTDAPLSYQWYKNGIAVPGAKSAVCNLGTAALATAGAYTCVAKNIAGASTSATAQVDVVQGGNSAPKVVAAGTTLTLTVSAAGNGMLYSWNKSVSEPGGVATFPVVTGAFQKTLVLPDLQASDTGGYYCVVQNGALYGIGFATNIVVVDAAPLIKTPVVMPASVVGGNYSFQVPMDPASEVTPVSYSATGLPPGLAINAYGQITGHVAGALTADKTFIVTLKATNPKGTTSATSSLLVHRFPPAAVGTYNGLVARDPLPLGAGALSAGLGGTMSVTFTSAATCTGKLTLGTLSYPLAGKCSVDPGSFSTTVSLNIPRKPPLHNLYFIMDVDSTGSFEDGDVRDLSTLTECAITAAINPWNTTTHKAPLAATYTSQIRIQNPTQVGTATAANIVYPQGAGFATMTVAPGGGVTWVGKMGDGTASVVTYATTMGQYGTIPVHLLLDGGHGSAHGDVVATADSGNVNNNLPLLDGVIDWYKSGAASATDHTYATGIPLFNLVVAGGQYKAPAGVPVLGIAANAVPGMNNAHLAFTDGGLTPIASAPPVAGAAMAATLAHFSLRLTSTNAADLSNTGGNTPALGLTLNAATGAMSGAFTLKDGTVKRKVSYIGLLVPRLSVNQGVGYFLLPELPATSVLPVLSGQVLLVPGA